MGGGAGGGGGGRKQTTSLLGSQPQSVPEPTLLIHREQQSAETELNAVSVVKIIKQESFLCNFLD